MVRWLFIPFSLDFLDVPLKKSDTSVKYKRLLNLTHHKQEPQAYLLRLLNLTHHKQEPQTHLLSCA